MVIHSLRLNDYRNYESFEINFHPRVNFIYGNNGQGKTNLIESIYFTTHLKSFRTPNIRDLCAKKKKVAEIQTTLSKHQVSHDVFIGLNSNQKRVIHNGKRIHFTSEFIKFFYSLLFAPDILTAFKEFPIERRNFFDRVLLLLDSGFIKTIRDYNKVKKQKNCLLRQGNKREVLTWNHLMSELIPDIVKKRQALVEKVNQILPSVYNDLTGSQFSLALKYRNDFEGKAELTASSIDEYLASKVDIELKKGFSVYGPHKDNFWLERHPESESQFFSQGEYRVSFLALQFAINNIVASELMFHPILLMDDIFSELDQGICSKIINYINSKNNQVFITSTEVPEALRDLGSSIKIVNGRIENMSD